MYKAGVIGCRGIGISHTTGIVSSGPRQPHRPLATLDEETLREFEQRWPDENLTLYRDHREMLARESLDIVTVATSDHRPRRPSRGCGQRRGQGHLLRKATGHQPRRRRPHDRRLRRQQHHPVGRSHPALHPPVATRQRRDRRSRRYRPGAVRHRHALRPPRHALPQRHPTRSTLSATTRTRSPSGW